MFQTVAVPLWLFVVIVAFATLSFALHFLFPSVRWFFRRRMERLVAELNKRLDRPIQPFKLMARSDMIARLVLDPKVMEAVVAEAAETGEPETVVLERARRYAREIVPSFSATVYFGFATRAARFLSRLIYKVRVGQFDADQIRDIDKTATVVFVMNHRSNMDYVLVTHLAASRSALSYAVGEWARVWPLSWLIRSAGAYFIRRKSNNPLYRRVLARYVQVATEAGVTQAVFPEGGLSLDGRVGPAKLGILSYIVGGYSAGGRDVVFIPVALNYDRVLEDRLLTAAAKSGERRFRASVLRIFRFVLAMLWLKVRGRFMRFGYAAVGFGKPLPLSEIVATGSGDVTERMAEVIMRRVRAAMPVLPVPLVAAVLLDGGETTTSALVERAKAILATMRAKGRSPHLPSGTVEAAVAAGLSTLTVRRIVAEVDGVHVSRPDDINLLHYYAASLLLDDYADAAAESYPAESLAT